MRPVFFLTDFGNKDYYVGAVKAVMLDICPDLYIIDITHEIEPFNVKHGAFVLQQMGPFLPDGAIVLAVVDPGVGTGRRAIVVKGRKNIFVAPDNGLVYPAASAQGILEIREIKEGKFTLPRSGTFDARDVFGPIAAHIACGLKLDLIGPKLGEISKLKIEEAIFEENRIKAEVLHVDRFGNVITNIPITRFENWYSGGRLAIYLRGGRSDCIYSKSYGKLGNALGIIPGSSGYMELSLKEGNASDLLKVKPGDRIVVGVLHKPI